MNDEQTWKFKIYFLCLLSNFNYNILEVKLNVVHFSKTLNTLPDLVSSTVPNPWGNRPVLFHFLCQFGLNAESLVGSLE